LGGVNVIKNFHNQADVRKRTYGEKAWHFDSILAQPIDAVIKVDYVIPECPIDKKEFLRVVSSILLGKRPFVPDYPVCAECKMKTNVCLYHKTNPIACMGPVTRAGCGAACPSVGNACEGCRGLIPDPNLGALEEVLKEHGVSTEDILKFYRMYNGLMGVHK
jgi:coenzyme F420-reducing hydrogenase gamma subunit